MDVLSNIQPHGLFNGQLFLEMKFFGGNLLIIFAGVFIGKFIHLDEIDNSDCHLHYNHFKVKSKHKSSLVVLMVTPAASAASSDASGSYLIGGIIALLIMAYLVYSLIRPEKF